MWSTAFHFGPTRYLFRSTTDCFRSTRCNACLLTWPQAYQSDLNSLTDQCGLPFHTSDPPDTHSDLFRSIINGFRSTRCNPGLLLDKFSLSSTSQFWKIQLIYLVFRFTLWFQQIPTRIYRQWFQIDLMQWRPTNSVQGLPVRLEKSNWSTWFTASHFGSTRYLFKSTVYGLRSTRSPILILQKTPRQIDPPVQIMSYRQSQRSTTKIIWSITKCICPPTKHVVHRLAQWLHQILFRIYREWFKVH